MDQSYIKCIFCIYVMRFCNDLLICGLKKRGPVMGPLKKSYSKD